MKSPQRECRCVARKRRKADHQWVGGASRRVWNRCYGCHMGNLTAFGVEIRPAVNRILQDAQKLLHAMCFFHRRFDWFCANYSR